MANKPVSVLGRRLASGRVTKQDMLDIFALSDEYEANSVSLKKNVANLWNIICSYDGQRVGFEAYCTVCGGRVALECNCRMLWPEAAHLAEVTIASLYKYKGWILEDDVRPKRTKRNFQLLLHLLLQLKPKTRPRSASAIPRAS